MRLITILATLCFLPLALIACGGPNTIKQAQNYCLENSPDDYSPCLKHRYRYLEERKKLVSRHRDDQNQCEEHALKSVGGDGNSCFHAGNTGTVSGGSASVSAGVSRNVDCEMKQSSARTSSTMDMRGQTKQAELEKQCMLARGWDNPRSPRKELRLLSREYGFEKEEYEAR